MIEVNNELYRLNSESDDIEERGLALYKRGRVFQLQENDKKALEMFILFIEEADRYQKDLSLNMRRYYCRAYIRAAHLLMKLDGDASSIEYYLRLADEKTNVLIETVESIDSLSTKAFYEEICAEYNKKINNSAQEMFHLENAIELCNRMLRRKNDRSYLNSKYRFLNRIYDIQVAMAEYDDALHTIEHMVDLDIILHDKCEISTLRKKYELYQILNMDTLEIKKNLEKEMRQ